VDVRGVRKRKRVCRIDEGLENRPRRGPARPDRVIQIRRPARALLPPLDPSGVDDLDPVPAGRAEKPRGVIAGLLPLAGVDEAQEYSSFPISTRKPPSTMGVSSSSACDQRAISGATAASNTVV
jgi:hypothetical protein